MRRAIADAEVGDDQLGDDPTTRALEDEVARIVGKERALFFPTGIMANQTALAVHGAWGSEVVVEGASHLFHWEDGAAAALSGIQLHPVPTDDGVLRPEHLDAAVRPASRYLPRTSLVCLENTHLASGGRVVTPDETRLLADAAHERGLPVHLDGARLWHAAAASGRPIAAFTRPVDSVMVALSKGLGAPVGSVLAGSADFIEAAWRVRRRLGGSMRQSGLLAAAGVHALAHHRERLVDDHLHARRIAEALGSIPGVACPLPETNVVLARMTTDGPDVAPLLSFLEQYRILMLDFGGSRVRAVTHLDVDSSGTTRVTDALEAFRERGEFA
jgi:threonine aldolase